MWLISKGLASSNIEWISTCEIGLISQLAIWKQLRSETIFLWKKGNRVTMHLLFYLFLILLLNIMIWDNLFCKGWCVKKMSWNLLWQLQEKKKKLAEFTLSKLRETGRFWSNHFSSRKFSRSKKQLHVLSNIFIFLQSRLSQVFTRFDRNWLESQPMERNEFITETIERKPPSSLPFLINSSTVGYFFMIDIVSKQSKR